MSFCLMVNIMGQKLLSLNVFLPELPSNNLENKNTSDNYWRVQLLCKKVRVQSSLKPPLKYN